MSIMLKLWLKWRGCYIGQDAYGNQYFEDRFEDAHGKKRRRVIYRGYPEASKVPSEWHGWLHYNCHEAPTESISYPWQKPHQQNLTGTAAAYRPKSWGTSSRPKTSYEPWVP